MRNFRKGSRGKKKREKERKNGQAQWLTPVSQLLRRQRGVGIQS
jgi:hypothetical protein